MTQVRDAQILTPNLNLDGRWVSLRPIRRGSTDPFFNDIPFLHGLAEEGTNLWTWREPRTVGDAEFKAMLDAGVLDQFVIWQNQWVTGDDGEPVAALVEPVGHVLAYNADVRCGTAHLAVVIHPDVAHQAWPMEAIALFLDFVFDTQPWLRMFLIEATEFNADTFLHGAQRILDIPDTDIIRKPRRVPVPGRDGEYWDILEMTIWRDVWRMNKYAHGKYRTEQE